MTTIYKYPTMGGAFSITMPQGAETLHFGYQDHEGFVWAKVDTDKPTELRRFIVVGTGFDIGDYAFKHIGTALDGLLVWHLFEAMT